MGGFVSFLGGQSKLLVPVYDLFEGECQVQENIVLSYAQQRANMRLSRESQYEMSRSHVQEVMPKCRVDMFMVTKSKKGFCGEGRFR